MLIVKGIIKAWDLAAYTASVQLVGSLSMYLESVDVSRGIPATEMVVDRSCAVLFFSESNFSDGVVFAVYG